MKTKIPINFRLLYQCIVLSVFAVSMLSAGTYLTYWMLSLLFASTPVFFSLFGLAVALGVLLTYDAEAFQWDNNPRVAIKRITEVFEDE